MKFRLILFFLATMVGQRILGAPGLPVWCADIQLLTVWLVAPALRFDDRRWIYFAVLLGIVWDILGQPVIGPGGIAWSTAALALSALAVVVADRSFRAWAAFGAVAAVVVVLVHSLVLMPLGFPPSLTAVRIFRTALFSGLWCGTVAAIVAIDFPKHWRAYRLRKLR
jgi:hypothetical protein